MGKYEYAKPIHAQILDIFDPTHVELSPYTVESQSVDLTKFEFSKEDNFDHSPPKNYYVLNTKTGNYDSHDLALHEIGRGGIYTP